MRTLLIFCFTIMVTLVSAQNTIFIVKSNTSTDIYTNLDTALIAAPSGAIVYIPGGTFSINQLIQKELHLRGAGTYPNYTLATGQTNISVSTTNNTLFGFGSDGSTVEGIIFSTQIYLGENIGSNTKLENIMFTKCLFTNSLLFHGDVDNTSQGNMLKQCIFSSIFCSDVPLMIHNCIIQDRLNHLENSIVENSIFLKPTHTSSSNNLWGCSSGCFPENCTFKNCIFRQTSLATSGSGNIYQHNLYRGSSFSFPLGSTGNLFVSSLDSIFVNYGAAETNFYFNFDYSLQATSIGENAGTDGTDIGIYGGSEPFVIGAIPNAPYIISKQISTSTDGNGNLHVEITVEARNN